MSTGIALVRDRPDPLRREGDVSAGRDVRVQRGATLVGKRILVVDDEPANCRLMERVLRLHGYETVTAGDATSAIAVLEADHVDLAIMDLGLPGMDGLALTRCLRTDPRWRSLPIVAWSGSVTEEDEVQARAAGCDGFLPKPVDIRIIPGVVARHLPDVATGPHEDAE